MIKIVAKVVVLVLISWVFLLVNFDGHTMLPMLLLELDMEWTVS